MTSRLIAATLAALLATSASADPAGYTAVSIDAPHHDGAVESVFWYPAEAGGTTITVAENPVFHGITVAEDAPVMAGSHPIVLLSHGMGGTIRSLAWLASDLAENGAVVVSVNHPNSTWGDFDLASGLQHWTRTQDLSLALDTLLVDPRFEGHLDTSQIMAAGFSYGGWTALSMAGLRGNFDGLIAHCKEYGAASSYCDKINDDAVVLSKVDAPRWNAPYADDRITQAFAIDPGLLWGLNAEDVADMLDEVTVIGLGEGESRLLAANFDASGFPALASQAKFDRIVPAMHFTALPICKPMGEQLLSDDNDDPVCTDPEGTDRAAVHATLVARMTGELGL